MGIHVFGKWMSSKSLIYIGLSRTFFGIGETSAKRVCAKLGFYPKMRVGELSEQQAMAITRELSSMHIEGPLKDEIRDNIQLKKSIGSYQGLRHSLRLPVHGQGTRNNARTARKLNSLERNF